MADIVLALKPKWLELILTGKKTVEVRRALPKSLNPGDRIFLYCKGDIHGVATVAGVKDNGNYYMWRLSQIYADRACLSAKEILDYLFRGSNPGFIEIAAVERYADPHPWRGPIPQNFIYYK